MIKVFCESIRSDDEREANLLRELSKKSDKRKYSVIIEPDKADVILLTDIIFNDFGASIMNNYLINQYPDKCFLIALKNGPISLFRGMYTNAEKTIFNLRRIRTCAYNTYPVKNRFVQDFKGSNVSKKYLFSFMGAESHPIRKKIFELEFKRNDIQVLNTSQTFNLWNEKNTEEGQRKYVETLISSKFSLCPRGSGSNSIRLFESMKLGVAPIIISDEWTFPNGPDWKKFSIIIHYNQISQLEDIVNSHESKWEEMGNLAKEAYLQYFDDNVYFDYLVDNCLSIKENQRIPERVYFKTIAQFRHFSIKNTRKAKNALRQILRSFKKR